MDADDLSGVAVATRGGVIVTELVAGMADRDLGLPCTPETRFQIASVSKQFTAAAVLLLAGQSRLRSMTQSAAGLAAARGTGRRSPSTTS